MCFESADPITFNRYYCFRNPNNPTISIELHAFSDNNLTISIELHGFSDASSAPYGVCINLLHEKENGDKKCVLGCTA